MGGFGNSLATGYEVLIQEHVAGYLLHKPSVLAELEHTLGALDPHEFGARLTSEGTEKVARCFLDVRPEPYINQYGNTHDRDTPHSPFFDFLKVEAEKEPFLVWDEFKLEPDTKMYRLVGEAVLSSEWWAKNKKEARKARRHTAAVATVMHS
jgi:hypothetical protein